MTKWFQLYVRAPNRMTAQAMKRIDDHLVSMFGASFVAPAGTPIQSPDGTWEVRVFDEKWLKPVRWTIIEQYELQIEREVEHTS